MKIIIFAGGTGKRFWPLSRSNTPKQFLEILGEKPMVRMTVDRLQTEFSINDIFLSTGKKYTDEVKVMLPDLPAENYIFEPEMRDTGPAVTLAVSYVTKLFPNEVLACIWSDHLIKDVPTFVQALKEGENLVKEKNKIVFVTVPARFASPHRGYIHFGEEIARSTNEHIKICDFKQFEEKPNEERAQGFIEDGHFGWNPGYWIFKGENYLNKVKDTAPQTYEVCKRIVDSNFDEATIQEFIGLERISADYIFAEKVFASEAAVVFAEFGWSDIGEWISLKEALQESNEANVIKGNIIDLGSKDTLIHNYEESKLVATIGLEGYVVVNTPDVVAIFPKSNNMKLKELLKQFEDNPELAKYL